MPSSSPSTGANASLSSLPSQMHTHQMSVMLAFTGANASLSSLPSQMQTQDHQMSVKLAFHRCRHKSVKLASAGASTTLSSLPPQVQAQLCQACLQRCKTQDHQMPSSFDHWVTGLVVQCQHKQSSGMQEPDQSWCWLPDYIKSHSVNVIRITSC